jgi:tetratricopeptide (TPR) repeat protein/SAM-dependent methyltransferase
MDKQRNYQSPSEKLKAALDFQIIGDTKSAENIYRDTIEIFKDSGMTLGTGDEIGLSSLSNIDLISLSRCFNNIGVIYKNSNRFNEARQSFIKAIEIDSKFENALNNLGNVYFSENNFSSAEHCFTESLRINPHYSDALNNLGNVYRRTGRLSDAERTFIESISINPRQVYAHINLGLTMIDQGRLHDAELRFRQASLLEPKLAICDFYLANISRDLGKFPEAEKLYRSAISLDSKFLDAHNELGKLLLSTGRLQCAEDCYQAAAREKPTSIEIVNNLGVVLFKNNKLVDAEKFFLQAIEIDSKFPDVHVNLGKLYLAKSDAQSALESAITAFNISQKQTVKVLIAKCLSVISAKYFRLEFAEFAAKALDETWTRPVQLVMFTQDLLLQEPRLRNFIEQTLSNPADVDIVRFLKLLSSEPLLKHLFELMLTSAPLSSAKFEQFLTKLRRQILIDASGGVFLKDQGEDICRLISVIARQCYINEYVYACSDEEVSILSRSLDKVSERLKANDTVSEVLVLLVACYEPLSAVPYNERLLASPFSQSVKSVLDQQVREPQAELALRPSIPNLTEIHDAISLAVQSQYEQNPYPRWVRLPRLSDARSINQRMRDLFPRADFTPLESNMCPSVLIAGCGTGQHPLEVACLLKNCEVLAVDLSIASLAYAKRKALESCINNVVFAQADILKLGQLGRKFDVIESGGVLHHMRDPFAAWDILLSLLKSSGLMKLGLYSAMARRHILTLREMIDKDGLGQSRLDIAAFRQRCLQSGGAQNYGWVVHSPDFFSTSGCRDLLFHVHEYQMTLPMIDKYLKHQGLKLLGFEIDHSVILAYQDRFPGDKTATNLSNWNIFEAENPDTFHGMYQFWIQKI